MSHLLVVRTRTGDQLHIGYVDGKLARRTSCGCRIERALVRCAIDERPELLCEKCFHPALPRENIKNAFFPTATPPAQDDVMFVTCATCKCSFFSSGAFFAHECSAAGRRR